MDIESVLIRKDWIKDVENILNSAQMEKLCYGLIMYGLYGTKLETDDGMLQMGLNLIYSQMDKMGATYSRNRAASELGAKKRAKLDPIRIWKLYNEENLSGAEILRLMEEETGCAIPPSTLYSNKGWQERDKKNPDFMKMENVEILEKNENYENVEVGNSENTKWEF